MSPIHCLRFFEIICSIAKCFFSLVLIKQQICTEEDKINRKFGFKLVTFLFFLPENIAYFMYPIGPEEKKKKNKKKNIA